VGDCDVAGCDKDHRHAQDEGRIPESQSTSRGARHGDTAASQHRPAVRNSEGAAHSDYISIPLYTQAAGRSSRAFVLLLLFIIRRPITYPCRSRLESRDSVLWRAQDFIFGGINLTKF